MEKTRVRVPGKLYIAGEYAVVEPGYSAIAIAVDRFIILEMRPSFDEEGSITSEGFTDGAISWNRINGKVTLADTDSRLTYVLKTIHTVEEYVEQCGVALSHFHLELTSELDHLDGQKFGLGSSGAVTIAVVRGLLNYYKISHTDLVVYKLGVLAQLQLGVNSSFGDLAVSSFTGWVHYTNFNHQVVQEWLQELSTREVIERDWPYLEIEKLDVSKKVLPFIGWTGSPASTHHLVGDVQEKKQQSPDDYAHFLKESKESVDILATALANGDETQIKFAIHKNRQALLTMGQQTNVVIETPKLTSLCKISASFGGAAKTSGAGGGDSGIAFIFDEEAKNNMIKKWKAAGITPLPLSVYSKE